LALPAAADAHFLTQLRGRLAGEPTVLAPESLPELVDAPTVRPAVAAAAASRRGRWSWMAPSAVAAGFVLVAGALVVTRSPAPSATTSPPAADPAFAVAPALPPVAMPSTLVSTEARFVSRGGPTDSKVLR